MGDTVRYTYAGQEAAQTLGTSGVSSMSDVTDGIVTSGKQTLGGLGEDNEGAVGMINAHQAEFTRAQEQLEAMQGDLRTDMESANIHEGVAGRVRNALGG